MRSTTRIAPRSAAANLRAPLWLLFGAFAVAAGIATFRPAAAQDAAAVELLPPAALEELVGPIALYPDDLVAIVLPASTYPLQIVEATRFLDARQNNPNLKADDDWDDSVVALLNYPEALRLLNDDLDWTWDLGAAVLSQRADVLDAVQDFRDRAYTAGNLRSDDRQVVTTDNGAIAIAPADPEVIYVPYYEPRRVLVYQTSPVFYYYPWGYPVYYYPYPAGYVFRSGFFWGVTSAFAIGWHSHNLHVHHYGYAGHPYFGSNYYDPYYARSDIHVNVNVGRRSDIWQPQRRYGGRPIVRGTEGRVADRSGDVPRVSRGVAGSAYRSGAESVVNRPARSSGAPAASRYPRDNSGAGQTGTSANANGRGAAAQTGSYRPRPTGEQGSRVTPGSRTQPPAVTAPRNPSPSAASGATRVYRNYSPQVQGAAPRATPPSAPRGQSTAPARTNGGGVRGITREPRDVGARSAPRSDGGGYRNGSSGRSQPQQSTRGGEGRSRQR